jgi:CheY-like chemotaxis protein
VPNALIVEDQHDLLDLYALALEVAGWTVSKASSADQALQFASQQRPDLVFTDLAMPSTDGLQLAECLRELFGSVRCPIVIITGQPNQLRAHHGEALPVCAILTKPVSVDALQEIAAHHFTRGGETCPGPAQHEAGPCALAGCR